MDYLLGGISAVLSLGFTAITYVAGYRQGKRAKQPEQNDNDSLERLKAERRMKEFGELMNYNLSTALKRKVK